MAGTQSIDRALQLLKLFDDNCPTWDLAGLVDVTGLNKTTVFRIVTALENAGLVERDASGAYKLGSEMIALGGRAARANDLRRVAHEDLRALSDTTGETTTLEILRPDNDGWCMLVIDEVLGRHLVGITQYIGSRLPVHATSTGKAVLAHVAEPTRYLPQTPLIFTDATRDEGSLLLADIQQARAQGYSVAIGELERGLVAIGAPVFDANGEVTAAISLVGPSVRLGAAQVDNLIPRVVATAEKISHQIGYRQQDTHLTARSFEER
jgi:IclR family acetate operon transcriptional repressor